MARATMIDGVAFLRMVRRAHDGRGRADGDGEIGGAV